MKPLRLTNIIFVMYILTSAGNKMHSSVRKSSFMKPAPDLYVIYADDR